MEPENFEFTDDDVEAWLNGQQASTGDELTRFVIDIRSQAESIAMHPSSQFAPKLAENQRRGEIASGSQPGHIAELDDIIESLTNLR